jgi:hypothetical protein
MMGQTPHIEQPPPVPNAIHPTQQNAHREGQGEFMADAYGEGSQMEGKKATEGGDPNRTDPITPATGATQTPATANSVIGANPLLEETKKTKQEDVLGNAEERANMGKGAFSGYEFAGPYDYPTFPSGRRDSELTALGGWRSKCGKHCGSIWKSKFTARGEPAKRDTYYKWSSKKNGGWSKLENSADRMKVFTKMDARRGGSRWMTTPGNGDDLVDLVSSQLKRKAQDNEYARIGGENLNKRRKVGSGRSAQK